MDYALLQQDLMPLKYFKQAKVVNLLFYNFQIISQDAQMITLAVELMIHHFTAAMF